MEKSVKTFGNKYFVDSFFNKPVKPKDVVYGKNHLQIGYIVKNGVVTKNVYRLNIEESFRACILGSTRSGKSFLLRGLSDRYAELGNAVVHLNDTKNEMFSSKYLVQEKFRHLLMPGETPKGFKILPLRPTFFRQIDDKLAKDNYWYSVDGRQMTRADFMTLMNATSLPPNQQTALEVIYQELQKRLRDDKDLQLNVELLYQIIDEDEEIAPATKRSLKFKLRPLEHSHFFVKEEEKNIVNGIKNGFIPTINVENFDSFGEGSFQFTEVLLSMVFREVRIARRAKKIKRLLVNLDEASRFIGNSRNTSIKTEMLSSSDLDTRYGLDLIFAWQSITDIPERILQQSRYIFVPNTADVRTIQAVLVNTGTTKNVQTSVRDAMYLKKGLKRVKFCWLVFDRMAQTKEYFIPLAPLSNHAETTKD